MTPNEALQLYIAIRLHFNTPLYDAIKYQFKVKTPANYNIRQDKYQFTKLAKLPDPKGILIANFSDEPVKWIGDIVSDKGKEIYRQWKKRIDSLEYTFTEDLKKLDNDCDSNFKVIDGQHPPILKMLIKKTICLETFVILNALADFKVNWDRTLENDLFWKILSRNVTKYLSFLEFDREKYRQLVLERFTNR